MKQGLTSTVFALICASFLATACDKRDNTATPPMPQTTTPGTTSPTTPPMTPPTGSMGGTGSSDAASAPGMGASK